jgi:ubiquinone/menaquinone biosynthesis C-methylase UbiE
MEFITDISKENAKTAYRNFKERILVYKRKGLDLIKSREFMLNKAEPMRGDILEIGTGSGYTTIALARAGYKFISVDKDEEALRKTALKLAHENILGNVKFYLMDGSSLTFSDESFSSVFVINLFHHVNEVGRMLSEIDRVLCQGGKAVLADFNQRGMEIVNLVHREEGRIHEDSGIGRDLVYSYFERLGYGIESYDEECHWLLIINKSKNK